MSFKDIAASMEWSDEDVEGGAKKAEAMLGRLDASWGSMESTTLAVMLAVVACARNKGAAQKCLGGMLGMLWKMEEAYLSGMSWQADPPSQEEMMRMSNEVDAAGHDLAESVTALGAAVMVGLLAAVPPTWGRHYKLLAETAAGLTKLLTESSASYFSGLLVDEQKGKSARMRETAEKTVLALNSRPADKARRWADRAERLYESVVNGGHAGPVALAEVIRREGFPDAAGITGRDDNAANA